MVSNKVSNFHANIQLFFITQTNAGKMLPLLAKFYDWRLPPFLKNYQSFLNGK